MSQPDPNEYLSGEHVRKYLSTADTIPHRTEGEEALLELLPETTRRVLDIGTGDGRLLYIVRLMIPDVVGVGVDFSPHMLKAARERFEENETMSFLEHDLREELPPLGTFDTVVSSFAIHHLDDHRKKELFSELFAILRPGGVFCNLEHVSSPTPLLHEEFCLALGSTVDEEDPSNRCAPVETHLGWLRDVGFAHVDCFWKWRELALLAGRKA